MESDEDRTPGPTAAGGDAGSWSGRSIGALWGWRICAACIRWLGRWPAYVLVTPIVAYYFLFARVGRGASREYLERLLGPAGGLRRTWRSFRQFHAYALALVDRYLFLLRGPGAFRRVEEGRAPVEAAIDEGRGLVLITSHLGNADLAGAMLLGDDVPVRTVRIQAERPEIRRLFEREGRARTPEVIDIAGEGPATLRILTSLREGCVVGMMGDRVVDGHWVDARFLGHPAPFPAGPFLVAATAGVPLAASFCLKEGARGYRVISLHPRRLAFDPDRSRDEQLLDWVGEFVGELEGIAQRYPYQWFNFFSIWGRSELPERVSADRVRSLSR